MPIPSQSRSTLSSGVVEERASPLAPAAAALDHRPRRQEEQDYGEWTKSWREPLTFPSEKVASDVTSVGLYRARLKGSGQVW